MVIISPNNPDRGGLSTTGCWPNGRLAEFRDRVVFSDEIYQPMTYEGAE